MDIMDHSNKLDPIVRTIHTGAILLDMLILFHLNGTQLIAKQAQHLVDVVHSYRRLPLLQITDKPQPYPGFTGQFRLRQGYGLSFILYELG